MNGVRYKYFFAFFFSTFFIYAINAQNYNFQQYGIQESICHHFVYTINQDVNGFLWIGTGVGLCKFDGLEFSSDPGIDSIMQSVSSFTFKDSKGVIWFGQNDGKIANYDGQKWRIIESNKLISGKVTSICEKEGKFYISTLTDGILVTNYNEELYRINDRFAQQYISAIQFHKDNLIIGDMMGLAVYEGIKRKEEPRILFEIEEINSNVQQILPGKNEDAFWILSETEGAFYLVLDGENKYTLQKIKPAINPEFVQYQCIFEDSDTNIWIGTYHQGLYKYERFQENGEFLQIKKFDDKNGLGSIFIKTVFEDREGNIWIGTYGKGLAFRSGQAIKFYTFSGDEQENNIFSIIADNKNIYLGGENRLIFMDKGENMKATYYGRSYGVPIDEISTLHANRNILWIGSRKNGIYKMNLPSRKVRSFFKSSNSLASSINYIVSDEDNIYAGTRNGIYIFNTRTNNTIHYNTITGLPHNNVKHIIFDRDNNLLFATKANGIYEIDVKGEVSLAYKAVNYELDFTCVAQDEYGKVWAATYGNGVFCFVADSFINVTANQGLKSNYCYSIKADRNGSLWVGHRLGISRINVTDYTVTSMGADEGIIGDCNFNALTQQNNIIYFGLTNGLMEYNLAAEKRKDIPPKTNITRLLISDKAYDINKDIVLPYGIYKLRIEFIGINFSNPKDVKYQYILDGYDLDWSDVSNLRYVNYPRIEDGEYTFKLHSFLSDGSVVSDTVEFNLKVKLPVWKQWWFYLFMTVIVIVMVLIIIKYRERKQKQIQEYLEKSLDERTREVVEQKEEIEIKNRDITDSINYAQRIQASILPPINKLQENFNGSFVYYQPRDIVSGDFYWFDKVNDDKFVIVCADSTGHGVPGAFMSLIGTTLIKDICMRNADESPSGLLKRLDEELRNTLNQNLEVGKANDGMDIVVCEINLKTNYLRYASAMRPMIVIKDGEQYYIKGSRSSVGGHYDSKYEKEFEDEGLQLSTGDLIYMFSDGYPDQFGGPMGKKFKMVRLKNLLKDIYQKSMDEQYEYVKSTFILWKEDVEQVDDVLFMGIRI